MLPSRLCCFLDYVASLQFNASLLTHRQNAYGLQLIPHRAASGLKTFTNYGGSGVHSGQTFQNPNYYVVVCLFQNRVTCEEYMYKGVETYLKNSTPPEDEGRSEHLKYNIEIQY